MIVGHSPWGLQPIGRSDRAADPGTVPAFTAAASGESIIDERGFVWGYGSLGRSPLALQQWDASTGANGAASATFPALTAAATGTETHDSTGTATASLPALTAAATGLTDVEGEATATLPALTGTALGAVSQIIDGTAAGTFAALSASATGAITFSATAAATAPSLTAAAVGLYGTLGTGLGTFPALGATATGAITFTGSATATLPALSALASGFTVQPPVAADAIVRYTCVLTGAADGLDDLTLPIATLQARHTSETSGTGAVTIPGALAYVDGISARPNGEIVVTWRQGGLSEELLRFPPTSIQFHRGAKSSSFALSGAYAITARAPRAFPLAGVSYITTDAAGSKRYRANGRGDIRPGDSVLFDGDTDTVTFVTWSVAVGNATMELTL